MCWTAQDGSVSLVAAAAVLGGVLAWGFSSRRGEQRPSLFYNCRVGRRHYLRYIFRLPPARAVPQRSATGERVAAHPCCEHADPPTS